MESWSDEWDLCSGGYLRRGVMSRTIAHSFDLAVDS